MKDDDFTCSSLVEDVGTVFSFLAEEEMGALCGYLFLKDYEAGAILMEKGDPGDYLGFLVSGKLAVKKETEFPGKYVIVAILESGAMVGETAVVEQGPRSSTVKAIENSRLLILTSDNMEKLSKDNPALGIKILKRILHILKLRLRQGGERLSKVL